MLSTRAVRPRPTLGLALPPWFLAGLIVPALLLAACGGSPTASASPSASVAPSDGGPGASDPGGSTPVGSDDPASATPIPSGVAACSGTDSNRDFYAGAADGVTWQVYCPTLPGTWQVQDGNYRLGSGGQLRIAYVGPEGARIELREGGWCATTPDTCNPSGTDAGEARFGDRDARIVSLDAGGFALVAEGGAPISWVLVASGLDMASVISIGEGLIPVTRP